MYGDIYSNQNRTYLLGNASFGTVVMVTLHDEVVLLTLWRGAVGGTPRALEERHRT